MYGKLTVSYFQNTFTSKTPSRDVLFMCLPSQVLSSKAGASKTHSWDNSENVVMSLPQQLSYVSLISSFCFVLFLFIYFLVVFREADYPFVSTIFLLFPSDVLHYNTGREMPAFTINLRIGTRQTGNVSLHKSDRLLADYCSCSTRSH